MACVRYGNMFICGSSPRRKRCSCCGAPNADRLCDHVIGQGKTCDAAICHACAVHRAPDTDVCKEHEYELVERETIQANP